MYVTNPFHSDNVLLVRRRRRAGGLLSPLSPATVAAGDGAGAVAVSPDGQSVYVTNGGRQHRVAVLGGRRWSAKPQVRRPPSPAGSNLSNISGPYGLAITPDGQSVYVADHGYFRGGGGLLPVPRWAAMQRLRRRPVAPRMLQPGQGGCEPGWPRASTWTSPEKREHPPVPTSAPGGKLSSTQVPGRRGRRRCTQPPIAVSPDGQSVYAADTGEDPIDGSQHGATILQYHVGAGGGKLWPKSPAEGVRRRQPVGGGGEPRRPERLRHQFEPRHASPNTTSAPAGSFRPRARPRWPAAGAYGVAVDQDGESVYVTNGSSVFPVRRRRGRKALAQEPAHGGCRRRVRGGGGPPFEPSPDRRSTAGRAARPTTRPQPSPSPPRSRARAFECSIDSGAYSDCGSPDNGEAGGRPPHLRCPGHRLVRTSTRPRPSAPLRSTPSRQTR